MNSDDEIDVLNVIIDDAEIYPKYQLNWFTVAHYTQRQRRSLMSYHEQYVSNAPVEEEEEEGEDSGNSEGEEEIENFENVDSDTESSSISGIESENDSVGHNLDEQ